MNINACYNTFYPKTVRKGKMTAHACDGDEHQHPTSAAGSVLRRQRASSLLSGQRMRINGEYAEIRLEFGSLILYNQCMYAVDRGEGYYSCHTKNRSTTSFSTSLSPMFFFFFFFFFCTITFIRTPSTRVFVCSLQESSLVTIAVCVMPVVVVEQLFHYSCSTSLPPF